MMRILKRGFMIIIDNGGAAKHILDDIVDYGDDCLTCVRVDQSNIDRVCDESDIAEYVTDDTVCIRHCFASSDKTSYLFFSTTPYAKGQSSAERKAKRMMEYLADARGFSKDPKSEKLVSVKRSPYCEVKNIKLELEMTLDSS